MTTASVSDLAFPTTTLLAGLASGLLLFVTVGVIYLSTVEWLDRRRRRSSEGRNR
ncbi:hypothetical protein H6G65_09460 [Microcystis elabens FACHB-917]|nr:hypothetical protein [Microcystis elabens FACHB-917]